MSGKLVRNIADWLGEAIDAVAAPMVDPTMDGEPWQADAPDRYCPRCGVTAGPGAVTERGCPHCLDALLSWDRLTRLSAYIAPMDQWVRQMKFHQYWAWASWFGKRLAEQIDPPAGAVAQTIIVCPVPMHWWRRGRRGYNQAHLMAKALARQRGWRMRRVLRRCRYTRPQTAVAPSRRVPNVIGSFALRRGTALNGVTVVLVDDIKTSGATLAVCSRLLRRGGAARVLAAVAAVADPPTQPSTFTTITAPATTSASPRADWSSHSAPPPPAISRH